MHLESWQRVSIALWALAACGDEDRCGDVVCSGSAGLPAAAAGSASPAQSAALQLTNAAQDSVVELTIGQAVELTLQTIGPGEYADPELSSAAVSFDGKAYAPLQNPGGPKQIYRFHALASGSVTISIAHTQGRPTFTLMFHVS